MPTRIEKKFPKVVKNDTRSCVFHWYRYVEKQQKNTRLNILGKTILHYNSSYILLMHVLSSSEVGGFSVNGSYKRIGEKILPTLLKILFQMKINFFRSIQFY